MSTAAHPGTPTPAAARGGQQRRQVTLPGSAKQKQQGGVRGGLLLLGFLLVVISGGAFWYVLRSVDQRQEYLVTARTNFSVIRTMQNGESILFAAGRYQDEIVTGRERPMLRSRTVVLESRRIDVLLVIPI